MGTDSSADTPLQATTTAPSAWARFFGRKSSPEEEEAAVAARTMRQREDLLKLQPDSILKLFVDRLRPAEVGRDMGAQRKPPSDAEIPDEFHITLRDVAVSYLKSQSDKRSALLHERSLELSSLYDGHPIERVREAYKEFSEVEVPRILEKHRPILVQSYLEFQETDRGYYLFRSEHRRTGTPKPAVNTGIFLMVALIGMLIEGWVQHQFLRDQFTTWIDSALWSVLISVVVSGSAYGIGAVFAKGLNYVDDFRRERRTARIVFTIAVFALVGLIALIAVIRTLHASHYTQEQLIWSNLWQSHPQSLLLAFMNVLFALFSFGFGYWMTGDTYPGYSSRHDHWKAMEQAFNDRVEDVRADIYKARAQTETAMALIVTELRRQVARYTEVAAQHKELADQVEREYDAVYSAVQETATIFRAANIEHRRNSEPPTYFQEPLPIPEPPGLSVADTENRHAELRALLVKVETLVVEKKAAIGDQLASEMKRLEALVAKAQGEAIERINRPAPILHQAQRDSMEI